MCMDENVCWYLPCTPPPPSPMHTHCSYELQRRLGLHGVTSCLADPGGVRSNIWATSPLFSKGFYK